MADTSLVPDDGQHGKSGLRQDERPLEDGGAPRLAAPMAHMIPGSHSDEEFTSIPLHA